MILPMRVISEVLPLSLPPLTALEESGVPLFLCMCKKMFPSTHASVPARSQPSSSRPADYSFDKVDDRISALAASEIDYIGVAIRFAPEIAQEKAMAVASNSGNTVAGFEA